jgi:hypothetical protein
MYTTIQCVADKLVTWIPRDVYVEFGTIYSWQLEKDLYQPLLQIHITAILGLYTIAYSPLESLLESLLERLSDFLFGSLLERTLHCEE